MEGHRPGTLPVRRQLTECSPSSGVYHPKSSRVFTLTLEADTKPSVTELAQLPSERFSTTELRRCKAGTLEHGQRQTYTQAERKGERETNRAQPTPP